MAIQRNFSTGSGSTAGAIRRPNTDPIYNNRPSDGRGTHTDVMSHSDRGCAGNGQSAFMDSDGNLIDVPDVFTGSNGQKVFYSGASQDVDSYRNVYELVKNYPDWLALLNANPYTGFNIPESLFDKLGLSNKARDKMNALRQEYMNYNAQVLANFMNWKNSLPETQREQLNVAGYASDLANVQPSSVPTEIPQGSNALAMPSGSTGEELMQVIGTAASLFSSGASIALGVMQTVANIGLIDKQKENLGKVGEGLDLTNFGNSLSTAKRIYSNLAPSLKNPKDPDEIMAAVSMQYPDAPESVNKALKNYVNSREFQQGLLEAETGIQEQESAFHQSFMTNEDLKMLVGSPDYWLGIRKIANETYMKQVEKINDYLDTLDVVKQVRSSNAYYDYLNQYYTELTSLGVPSLSAQAAVMQNRSALATYDMQRSLAERNKSMLEIKNQEMQEYFEKLTSVDTSAWTKWWAAFQLTSGSFFSRWTDPSSAGSVGSTPFSPVGMSQPTLPAFTLPTMK